MATPSASRWDETPGRVKGSETPGVTPHRPGSETPGATPSTRIWEATPSHVTPGHATPGHATPGGNTTPGKVFFLCAQGSYIFIYIYVLILGQLLLISNGLCLITRHFINQEKSLGWNSQDRKRFVVFSMSIISSFLGSCWFWREVSPVLSSSVFTVTAAAFKHDLDLLTFFPLHFAQWNN